MTARGAALITGFLIGAAVPGRAAAQDAWEARLAINAYPSPYLSDWESNPTIGTLTITNPSAADQDVLLVYRVTDHGGRVIASGRSDPELIMRGPPTVLTDFVDISGSSEHDQGLEDQMRRTGRLPEGDQTACVAVTDQGGFVLAEDCVTFTIVYPDPPYLIGPIDDGPLTSGNPVFQWTPLQVPAGFQLTFVLRVSEVLENQAPAQALVANIPVYEATTFGTSLEYPINAPPLEEGKVYAWRVQALDQNGYAASANEGRSEAWTFRYTSAGAVNPEEPAGPYRAQLVFFDPATEWPELWAMLDSTTFDRFLDYLILKGRDGTLEIPLPLPGLLDVEPEGVSAPGGGPAGSAGLAAGGPPAWLRSRRQLGGCLSAALPDVQIDGDRDKKSAGIMFTFEGGTVRQLLACFGVPEWNRPAVNEEAAILFAVDWGHGVPRVTLGLKPRVFQRWGADGFNITYAVFILNLLGDFTLRSADLPAKFEDFYGTHEIGVWGTGVIDLGLKLKDLIKQRSRAALGEVGGQVAMNFYAVVNLGLSPQLLGTLRNLGVTDDLLTLRGFRGYREKTYRGGTIGGAAGAAWGEWAPRRSPLKLKDNWFVRASVPTRPPAWWSAVQERRLELEIGSMDSSLAQSIPLYGDTTTKYTRWRILLRDVLSGFDGLKTRMGVSPDSVIEFYAELKLETTGAATALGGAGLSGSYGFDGSFRLFDGAVHLHDPRLTVGRRDQTQAILTNPLYNARFSLGGAFGFGQAERIGTLELVMTTQRPDSAAESQRQTEATAAAERAEAEEDYVWRLFEEASQAYRDSVAKFRSLPEGNSERRSLELLGVPAADAILTSRRKDWEQTARRAQSARRAAGPRRRPQLGFEASLRFDQGASVAELIEFVLRTAKSWSAP